MAKAPMTERLDNAINKLAEISGWKPEKAADHIATMAEGVVDKAESKARDAALKLFTKGPGKTRGRRAAAVG